MTKVAIVGSRRRSTLRDRQIVIDLVELLVKAHGDVTIVSGGCPKGADAFAEEAAKIFGLPMIIHPVPRDPPIRSRGEFAARAFARNEIVANDCDIMYAFVAPDRKGGTENTVEHGIRLGKKVFLVDDHGFVYLSPEEKTKHAA
jgi:predicted Rossmann fold nucleotide-binding protein DprA/Smf involved in DNA uptake